MTIYFDEDDKAYTLEELKKKFKREKNVCPYSDFILDYVDPEELLNMTPEELQKTKAELEQNYSDYCNDCFNDYLMNYDKREFDFQSMTIQERLYLFLETWNALPKNDTTITFKDGVEHKATENFELVYLKGSTCYNS